MLTSLAELRLRLGEDDWRKAAGFSPDIEAVTETLLNPLALDSQRQEVLQNWLQGHHIQPCIFGKIAARNEGMHFCFLSGDDLTRSDDHIRSKIADARRLWKRRAIFGMATPGFMVVVCDDLVFRALPDHRLYEFALHLQEVAGWKGRPDARNNEIVDEWLYLTDPGTGDVVKFTFSVDFFASAADKRWWNDHRVPGGMAFTANSLGHMVRQMEWYGHQEEKVEWALRTAMNTIDSAAKHPPFCPATYLLDEGADGPLTPYTWREAANLPRNKNLIGKDYGSYGGHLHTDHAIRAEFFDGEDRPAHYDEPYRMDFTYIFDRDSADHRAFMIGEPATREEVDRDLLSSEGARAIAMTTEDQEVMVSLRPKRVADEIEEAVSRTRAWRLTDDELAALL